MLTVSAPLRLTEARAAPSRHRNIRILFINRISGSLAAAVLAVFQTCH